MLGAGATTQHRHVLRAAFLVTHARQGAFLTVPTFQGRAGRPRGWASTSHARPMVGEAGLLHGA